MQIINFIKDGLKIRAVATGDKTFDVTEYRNRYKFNYDVDNNVIITIRTDINQIIYLNLPATHVSFEGTMFNDIDDMQVAVEAIFNGNGSLGPEVGNSDWVLGDGWSKVGNALRFTDPGTGGVSAFDITNFGTGYQADDILTVNGGNHDSTIHVNTVDGDGVITDFDQVAGSGYVPGDYALTGGHGVGATISVTGVQLTGANNVYQEINIGTQKGYRIEVTMGTHGGNVQVLLGDTGVDGGRDIQDEDTVLLHYIVQGQNNLRLTFIPSPGFGGDIQSISVKQVVGGFEDGLSQNGSPCYINGIVFLG